MLSRLSMSAIKEHYLRWELTHYKLLSLFRQIANALAQFGRWIYCPLT